MPILQKGEVFMLTYYKYFVFNNTLGSILQKEEELMFFGCRFTTITPLFVVLVKYIPILFPIL
jgi:hypothetical protein